VLTQADGISLYPRLSFDGSLLAWREFVDRQPTAFITKTADPAPHELCRGCMVLDFFANGEEALVWQPPNRLVRRSLVDGSEVLVLDPGDLEILDADLSSDDRWLALYSARPDGRPTIHVIAVRDPAPHPEEWIEVTSEGTWVGPPRWSGDDRRLYYLSNRDDFNCIWAQPLDAQSKRPAGIEIPIVHAHHSTMKMWGPRKNMGFDLTVGRRYLAFNAAEQTGEIYAAMLQPRR
jgi:hypothetical protein